MGTYSADNPFAPKVSEYSADNPFAPAPPGTGIDLRTETPAKKNRTLREIRDDPRTGAAQKARIQEILQNQAAGIASENDEAPDDLFTQARLTATQASLGLPQAVLNLGAAAARQFPGAPGTSPVEIAAARMNEFVAGIAPTVDRNNPGLGAASQAFGEVVGAVGSGVPEYRATAATLRGGANLLMPTLAKKAAARIAIAGNAAAKVSPALGGVLEAAPMEITTGVISQSLRDPETLTDPTKFSVALGMGLAGSLLEGRSYAARYRAQKAAQPVPTPATQQAVPTPGATPIASIKVKETRSGTGVPKLEAEGGVGSIEFNNSTIAKKGAPAIISGVKSDKQGQGVGKALYLNALAKTDVLHDPSHWSEKAGRVRQALVRDGLAEVVKNDKGFDVLRITQAGRDALKATQPVPDIAKPVDPAAASKVTDIDILVGNQASIIALAKAQRKVERDTLRELFGVKGAKRYRQKLKAANSPASTPAQAAKAIAEMESMLGALSESDQVKLNNLMQRGYTSRRLAAIATRIKEYSPKNIDAMDSDILIRQTAEILMQPKPSKNISRTWILHQLLEAASKRPGVNLNTIIKEAVDYMESQGVKRNDAFLAVANAVADHTRRVDEIGQVLETVPTPPVAAATPGTMADPSTPPPYREPPTPPKFSSLFAELRDKLASIIQNPESRDYVRALERDLSIDSMTGVGTGKALSRVLRTAEADDLTSVVLFDANNFGRINKAAGHDAGDSMIVQMARAIKKVAEEMGLAGETNNVYRSNNAGDEFVALVPKTLADKFIAAVEDAVGDTKFTDLDGSEFIVSITGNAGATLKEADSGLQALKKAKKSGQVIRQRISEAKAAEPEVVDALVGGVDGPVRGSVLDPAETKIDTSTLPEHSKNIQNQIETDIPSEEPGPGIVESASMAYTRLVRKVAPIERAVRAITGGKIEKAQDPAIIYQLSAGSAGRAEQSLLFQTFRMDENGNITFTGDGLKKILGGLKGRLNEYRRAAIAARVLELAQSGREIETGVRLEDAAKEWSNAPDLIKKAVTESAAFRNRILDYWADAGGVSKEALVAMKLLGQHYVSLQRVAAKSKAIKAKQSGDRIRYAALSTEQAVRELLGSKLKIMDPIRSTVDMTRRLIRNADINRVGLALVKMAEAHPDAAKDWIRPMQDAAAVESPDVLIEANTLRGVAKEAGIDLDYKTAKELAISMSDNNLMVEGDVMRVWQDGKLKQYKVAPEIGVALRALGPQEIGLVMRMVGLFSPVVKFGVTADPFFAVTQTFVGMFQTALQTKHGFVPGKDTAIGFIERIKNGQYRQEYLAGGSAFSNLSAAEFNDPATAARRVLPKTAAEHVGSVLMSPIETWRAFLSPLEEVNRLGAFVRARQAGASVAEAALEARVADTDFSMIGAKMAAAAHAIPFLNPFIQGMDTFRKAWSKDRAATIMLMGGASITLPSLYLRFASMDDQDVQDLQQSTVGQFNWIMRLPNGKIGQIRKPYVWGQVFGNTAEAVWDKMLTENPRVARTFAEGMLDQVAFNLIPPPLAAYIGINLNRDTMRGGTPIVPQDLENVEEFLQARPETGETARIIGERLNISPAKLEFAVRQLGGTLPSAAIKVADQTVSSREGVSPPTRVEADWPLVGRFFARYPSTAAFPVKLFYERAGEALKVSETLEKLNASANPDAAKIEAYMREHETELGLIPIYAQTRKEMTTLRKTLEAIRVMPDDVLSPDKKRKDMDYITRQMIELARAVNAAAEPARGALQGRGTGTSIEQAKKEMARDGIPAFQREAHQGRISEALGANVAAYGYPDETIKGILTDPRVRKAFKAFITPGKIKDNKISTVAASGWNLDPETGEPTGQRDIASEMSDDAWQLYLGRPQKHKTIDVSDYRPTNSKNPNQVYFKVKDAAMLMVPFQTPEDIKDTVQKLQEAGGKIQTNDFGFANYQLTLGKDDKGPYVAYYDIWDFGVPGAKMIGKPFEFYDRIYYDPKTHQPTDPEVRASQEKFRTRKERVDKSLKDYKVLDGSGKRFKMVDGKWVEIK